MLVWCNPSLLTPLLIMLRSLHLNVLLFGVVLFAGCGGKDLPEIVPVEGVVNVNGKPTAALMVQFFPEPQSGGAGTSFYATGVTDAQGKYVLEYEFDGKQGVGATVGPQRVVITDTTVKIAPPGQRQAPPAVSRIYSNITSTPLRVEVKAGETNYHLDVKK